MLLNIIFWCKEIFGVFSFLRFWKLTRFLTTCLSATSFQIWTFSAILYISETKGEFLRSTSLLYKILPTSLGTCRHTFYTLHTSHLRWNSTLRRCFYHTDPGQNAVFQNFAKQIALIQYSGRSKYAWAFSETVKKHFQSHLYS